MQPRLPPRCRNATAPAWHRDEAIPAPD